MSLVEPYGSWPSPITAASVAEGGVPLRYPRPVGDEIWWTEGRPTEGGRQTVVARRTDGTTTELLAEPWNARTRVHEYGGQCWVALPTADGHALVFAHYPDQRLYRLDPDTDTPTPITPEPDQPAGLRYADLVVGPDGEVWCVREAHTPDGIRRHIVVVPANGSAADDPARIREVVSGSDFLAWPLPSDDGRRIAWIAWDHPRMPWDGTELRVGDLDADGTVSRWRTVLGGPTESVFQPEWAGPDQLYAISDRSGWWNPYRVPTAGGDPVPLCPRDEEFGMPPWVLGTRTYAVVRAPGDPLDGHLAVLHGTDQWALGLLNPDTGDLTDLDLPYQSWMGTLTVAGTRAVDVAAAPTLAHRVVVVDLRTGVAEEPRRSLDEPPDPAYLPVPHTEALPGPSGREIHAHIYPPTSPDRTGPADERPPYIVVAHGGPTSQSPAALSLAKAYFTSRGIGVIDVNYGGSTGYGRAYRERLRGQWGVVDVEDVAAAALALVERGEADGSRLAIRGGSAGGWTTLAALTGTDTFSAGASYFGVAELLDFVKTTHDFESRYIDGLVGPLPEARDLYVERAPLSHVDDLSCPVLLLQGDEDRVVPPAQAEMFRDALVRKGIPHAYLLFEGEQHGFRRAENTIAALEAELSFYGQVFGFTPPDVPRLTLTTGH